MAKKNFIVTQADITTTLAGSPQIEKPMPTPEAIGRVVERIMTEQRDKPTGKNKGLKHGEERVSFVLLEGQYEKLQAIAYWERKTLKDTVIDILEEAFGNYESNVGVIRPKPIKKR